MYKENISISVKGKRLRGEISIPEEARGIILFPYSGGNTKFLNDYREIAGHFSDNNFATLIVDLLTEEEAVFFKNNFRLNLLSSRIIHVTEWLQQTEEAKDLDIGYFGIDTNVASALMAASELNTSIHAIVSYGGRADLAKSVLPKVFASTLLLCGSLDSGVINISHDALRKLGGEKEMCILPGASQLFSDHKTLNKVAQLSLDWFQSHLTGDKIITELTYVLY